MSVLVVTQYYYPESFKINDIVNEINKNGSNVIVLTSYPNYPNGHFWKGYKYWKISIENTENLKVIRIPQVSRGSKKGIRLFFNYLSFMISASIFAPFILRSEKIKSIFVYQPSPATVFIPSIIISKLKKAKLIYWISDLWPNTLKAAGVIGEGNLYRIWYILMCYLHKKANEILISCKGFKPHLIAQGIDSDKIKYWPQWAEDIFTNTKQIHEQEIALSSGFNILFAGNIGSSQAFDVILDAAEYILKIKKNVNIHWNILGDGIKKEWVSSEVLKRGLSSNFHLLGRKPLHEMPKYYESADILLASLNKDPLFEITVPAKIQSYLASAKPILLSIDGEATDIIKEANAGITAKAGDSQDLVEKCLLASNMSKLELLEMGKCGKNYFDKNFCKSKLMISLKSSLEI